MTLFLNARFKKSTIRLILMAMLASLLVVVSGVTTAPTARATSADSCDGTYVNNNLRVTSSQGKAFYIDSGQGQNIDASYVGYRVNSSVSRTGLWVKLSDFTGGVISLANPLDAEYALDSFAGSDTKTAYFLLKAPRATTTAQKHLVSVYSGRPDVGTLLYSCTYTFTRVTETIKANPNKVSDISVSTIPSIGGTFTVSVLGNTGTIGSGKTPDFDSMWLTPAALSSWPTRAMRLEKVEILLDNITNLKFTDTCDAGTRCFTDQLLIEKLQGVAVSLGASSQSKLDYWVKYTFRVIGQAPSVQIKPIAQISSGNQMKHTPLNAFTGQAVESINLSSVSLSSATISKVVNATTSTTLTTTGSGSSTYFLVPYKVTVVNSGASSMTIDKVLDIPDAAVDIDSTFTPTTAFFDVVTGGSSSSTGTLPVPAKNSSGEVIFSGPITIADTGRVEITYRMKVPQCPTGTGTQTYSNKAYAAIGSTNIGSSVAGFMPSSSLSTSCSSTTNLNSVPPATTVQIPIDIITNPATSVANNSATLNGLVDSNGQNGQAITFEWGTTSSLGSSINSTPGTTTTSSDPISVSASLTGLSSGTLYYFRVKTGSVVGQILTFATTEPVGTPTIVTDAPTNVSQTDATLNATVDPNLTEVEVAIKIWRTTDTATVWLLDDPSLAFNSSSNPRSVFSGSYPTSLSINMTDVATNLSSWISNGTTVYYRAEILSGATTIVASETKQFTFASYLNQSLVFDPISDITWGAAAPTDSASATSGMEVIFTSQTTDVCTVTTSGVITVLKAGICSIAANQPGGLKTAGTYYNPADEVIQSFTINPESITITADVKSKNYGETDPALTYTVTTGSLKFSDAFTGSLSRASGSNVGTYAINQGNVALSSNYILSFISANFTISARPITVTAAAKTKVYGAADPAFTYSVTSGALVSAGDLTGSLSRTSGEDAGTYAIGQNTLIATSNYSLTYIGETLTITSKPLTIKAENKTKAAGQSAPSFTYSLTGLVGSDSITAVTLTFSATSPSYSSTTSPTADGNYVITPSAETFGSGSASNYNITYETGTYTITNLLPQVLTWTAITTKTYGDTASATVSSDQSLTVTITSLSTSVCTVPSSSVSGATVTILTAGTCQLNASQAGNGSIAAANDVTTSFTVNPKPLTVTASSHSVTEGDVVPSITASYATFAFSETVANLTGTLTCSTAYTTSSTAGTYATSCSASGFSSSNYTISYVSGSITVSAASVTTYTITYDINGGSGTTPTETAKSNGQTFTTPSGSGFSRGGFSFGGWSCNSVTTAINTLVTVGTSNFTCVAIWNRNASSSPANNNAPATPGTPAPVKKTATAKLVTIATTPVKSTISVAPTESTPAPTPGATPTPAPTPGATPTPAPTPGTPVLPDGVTLSTTTVIPTTNTKSLTFKGSGVSKVAVVNEEISVEAKKGFSGKTTVVITLTSDTEISEITAEVLVIPLPVTNPVVKEVNSEKTRINWVRSPNAIGYEVTQNGVVLCTTKAVTCTLNRNIPANPPVEIKALGKDQTESIVKEAAFVAAPVRVVPDVALVVNFGTNKFNLDLGDRILIENFAFDVQLYGFKEVDISGHTDSRGGVDNNVLSDNRAKSARAYLLKLIPNLKVTINGFADAISVAPNTTTAGLAANRRAEFRVVK